jgi:hypothetical protein
MVKIAFWDNGLGERGTSVSLFDYAYFNQTILKNQSIVIYNTNHSSNNEEVIERFKNNFEVFGVSDFGMVDKILFETGCDIFYIIKAGEYEGQISRVIKTVVHCVFNYNQPHGNVYAGVSYWLRGNNGCYPVVPHIVHLPEYHGDMRKELGIPENATVFGRHGGYGQFDIHFVHGIVYNVAKTNPNIYFLFVNTQPFCEPLPNIIHIGKIIDLFKKVEFINTCDAMLWARSDGETFGLAIAEFSIKNKPVLLTVSGDEAHIHLMKDKGIWYNENTLRDILIGFNKEEMAKKDWNAYRDYSPEKVMQIFKRVFIDN